MCLGNTTLSQVESQKQPEITKDSLFSGKLICYQHKKGYRFSIDPVLLAHYMEVEYHDRILDLGTGCGVIPLIVHYRYPEYFLQLTGIEIQLSLYDLAHHNVKANSFENNVEIHQGDIRQIKNLFRAESFDKVVCNPPFFTKENGRQSSNVEARCARHQVQGSLEEFLRAAAYCLKNRAAAFFIYPADQIVEIIDSAQRVQLEPKTIQFIYSYPEGSHCAKLALVKFVKNGKRGCNILLPHYVYESKNGAYSGQMARLYSDKL